MTVLFIQYFTLLQYAVAALVLLSELATRCGFPFNVIQGELDFRNISNKHFLTQKHQSHAIKINFIDKRMQIKKSAKVTVKENKIFLPLC
jgi:hypothetical protein